MKKLFYTFTALLVLFCTNDAFGWGQKGHDIVAYIAECNLTPKAKKRVEKALGGHILMYYSSWMDNIRNLPQYAITSTWHYANVDEGESYETMRKEPAGDVYTATTAVLEELKNWKSLPDSVLDVNLRYLIHMIGDMHCPMHAGRLSDLGGNRFPISWFSNPTNLHSIWDTALIESVRKWSYTEWQRNIDNLSKKEIAALTYGTPLDWFNETVVVCKEIYLFAEEDANYSWDYMFRYYPVLELQLQRAGYRLAHLLNSIFG